MRGDYLFYEEKLEATQEERDLKAARRYEHLCLV
jgi:Gti1/Pac2 family transcription factor